MIVTRQKKALCFFFTLLVFLTGITAQGLADSTAKKIDSLFKQWNDRTPGFAIGVVKNDSLIYARGYGMANLEYTIPNSPETIFHMASISKQFTAWSVILLASQGKLKLDDDIHRYLAWFPDLKHKITIRNLLNHTSGIRDQWQLLAISGTRIDDVITQQHIIKLLSRQTALNFVPGTQYSYSNSGFTLLAEIVRSVTGQSLRTFTDSAIFKPLGMNHTHFHDDYTEIVPNRAYSYQRTDSVHFSNSILSYSTVGGTSLFTNVSDMSKWIMNFYNMRAGDQSDIDQLTQKTRLSNGRELSYASGIVAGSHNGYREYLHGGADAGYRTYTTVFPDLKMGFIVFSNLGDVNTGSIAYKMADLFIRDSVKQAGSEKKQPDSSAAVLKDTSQLRKFLGNYISEDGSLIDFSIRNAALVYQQNDHSELLIPQSKDSFFLAGNPEATFAFRVKGRDTVVTSRNSGNAIDYRKYDKDRLQTDKILQAYTGTYYCPELDCKYGIVLKDHHLVLTNNKYEDAPLTLMGKDDFSSDYWWISHFKMLRDASNAIVGFEISNGRIMHLRFNKK